MPEALDPLVAQLVERGNEEKLAATGYGLSYFEQLRTEWSLIADPLPPEIGQGVKERLATIFKKSAPDLTWDDLYAVERLLTHAVPLERLKRLAIVIRAEYREAMGADRFNTYKSGPPGPADGTNEPALRADIAQLQAELHWSYVIQPVEEQLRNRLTGWVLVSMVLLAAVVVVWSISVGGEIPPLAFVAFAGALGASFSAQRRIQTMEGEGGSLANIMRSGSVRLGVQIAPVIGALSAAVLAFLFASGLLGGALFPEVAITGNGKGLPLCTPLFFGTHDVNGDLAKLMIWAFIAGFAERLVPDALDRLASDAAKQTTKSSAG